MRPLASLKARRALCQSSTNPYCEGDDVSHRVLRGALSRLEPSAVKVASSVLRGGVDRKVCPLPDMLRFLISKRLLFAHYPALRIEAKRMLESSPGGFHPEAHAEPDVSVSTHPAPIIQPEKGR